MKTLIALTLFVAFVAAGILPAKEQNFQIEGRITNGVNATRGQFPYQVGLTLHIVNATAWCGGTLISKRWIITAAHCTYSVYGVTVFLGAFDIKNDVEKGQHRIYCSKSHIIVHEKYKPPGVADDISLIKMPVQVDFNEIIQPAVLPKKNEKYSTYEEELVWASGWGKISDSAKEVSQFLQFIEVPVMKKSNCNKFYFGSITNNMLCINSKGHKSTCNGDSGGPLVHKNGNVNTLIGATSFGIALGCEVGWPAVFTRVSSYLDWIEAHSGVVNK